MGAAKARVLFLCVGNSARSQMAEGLLRHLAGDRFDVASAGTYPTGLNPLAVEVMSEIGVDISKHWSKKADEFGGRGFEYVITVCDQAKEACPLFPDAGQVLHWSINDPAAVEGSRDERLAVFRRIRDQVAGHIRSFIAGTA